MAGHLKDLNSAGTANQLRPFQFITNHKVMIRPNSFINTGLAPPTGENERLLIHVPDIGPYFKPPPPGAHVGVRWNFSIIRQFYLIYSLSLGPQVFKLDLYKV